MAVALGVACPCVPGGACADPYGFCSAPPTIFSWGSPTDIATMQAMIT
jgi:hypothetical protein